MNRCVCVSFLPVSLPVQFILLMELALKYLSDPSWSQYVCVTVHRPISFVGLVTFFNHRFDLWMCLSLSNHWIHVLPPVAVSFFTHTVYIWCAWLGVRMWVQFTGCDSISCFRKSCKSATVLYYEFHKKSPFPFATLRHRIYLVNMKLFVYWSLYFQVY